MTARACSVCRVPHSTRFKACESCRAKNRKAQSDYAKRSGYKKPSALNVENVARWRRANPDKARAARQRCEARRRAIKQSTQVAPFTAEQLAARLSMYAGCWICGTPRWDHVDHVKPLAKGGAHILANLRPACASCNQSKSAAWPLNER